MSRPKIGRATDGHKRVRPTKRAAYVLDGEDCDWFVVLAPPGKEDAIRLAYFKAVEAEEVLSIKAAHHEPGGQYMSAEGFVTLLTRELEHMGIQATVYWADTVDLTDLELCPTCADAVVKKGKACRSCQRNINRAEAMRR
ncbi:MAG: hypothetical protein PHI12_07900 [Dehalococcoidales bacterium]|jgi:hypothetical protein|nr:hypothetical protein [Dehalococcoidales bacterium]